MISVRSLPGRALESRPGRIHLSMLRALESRPGRIHLSMLRADESDSPAETPTTWTTAHYVQP
ncbi:MAG TPA: hypothetical protein VKB85_00510 [Propionibacteriaceae bacterium]|nr:hypothetical protein [Propionibacteriaceae bacterium]